MHRQAKIFPLPAFPLYQRRGLEVVQTMDIPPLSYITRSLLLNPVSMADVTPEKQSGSSTLDYN